MKKCKTCGTLYEGFACPVCHPELNKTSLNPKPAESKPIAKPYQPPKKSVVDSSQSQSSELSAVKAELLKVKGEKEKIELENAKNEIERLRAEKERAELQNAKLEIERLKAENEKLKLERDKAVLDSVKAEKNALEREVELLKAQKEAAVAPAGQFVYPAQGVPAQAAPVYPAQPYVAATAAPNANYAYNPAAVRTGKSGNILQKLSAILPACAFLLFALLNLIFFATPVAKFFGEGVANFYECLNEENFLLLPNPLEGGAGVLIIEIIALLFAAAFAILAFLPKFKDKFIRIGSKEFSLTDFLNVIALVFTLVLFITSIICMAKIKEIEYDTGSCFVLILVFSIIFFIFNALCLGYRLYLHKKGELTLIKASEFVAAKNDPTFKKTAKPNKSNFSYRKLSISTKIAKSLRLLGYALLVLIAVLLVKGFKNMFDIYREGSYYKEELTTILKLIKVGVIILFSLYAIIRAIPVIKHFNEFDYYKKKNIKTKNGVVTVVNPKYNKAKWFVLIGIICLVFITAGLVAIKSENGCIIPYDNENLIIFKGYLPAIITFLCWLGVVIFAHVMLVKNRNLFITKAPKKDENDKKIKNRHKWQLVMRRSEAQENLEKELAVMKAYKESVRTQNAEIYESAKTAYDSAHIAKLKLVGKRMLIIVASVIVAVCVLVSVLLGSTANNRMNVFSLDKITYFFENSDKESISNLSDKIGDYFGEDYEIEQGAYVYKNQALKDYEEEMNSYLDQLTYATDYTTVLTYTQKIEDLQEKSGEMGLKKLTIYGLFGEYECMFDACFSEATAVTRKKIDKIVQVKDDNRFENLETSISAKMGIYYTDGSYACYTVSGVPVKEGSKYYLTWEDSYGGEAKYEVVKDTRVSVEKIFDETYVTLEGSEWGSELFSVSDMKEENWNAWMKSAIAKNLSSEYDVSTIRIESLSFESGITEYVFAKSGKIKVEFSVKNTFLNEYVNGVAEWTGDTTAFEDYYKFVTKESYYDAISDCGIDTGRDSDDNVASTTWSCSGGSSSSGESELKVEPNSSKYDKLEKAFEELKTKAYKSMLALDELSFDKVFELKYFDNVYAEDVYASVFEKVDFDNNYSQAIENLLKKDNPTGKFRNIEMSVITVGSGSNETQYLKFQYEEDTVGGYADRTKYYRGDLTDLTTFIQMSMDRGTFIEDALNLHTGSFKYNGTSYNSVKTTFENMLSEYNASLAAFGEITLSDGSVIGTWKFVSMTQTYEGQTQEMKAGEAFQGMDITENYMVFEFKEDGTFTQTMTVGTYTDTESGTWKQDGKTVTITMGSENTNGTIDGNKLTFVSNPDVGASMTLVLKKA